MQPDGVRHNFIVKVLDDCPFDLVAIVDLGLEQVLVLDASRAFVEELGLLVFVLDGLG